MLQESMKFEDAQKDPAVYECLLSMSNNYNSGYHLLKASRNLISGQVDETKQYSYKEDMLHSKQNFQSELEKIIEETIEEYQVSNEKTASSEISEVTFNPDGEESTKAEAAKEEPKEEGKSEAKPTEESKISTTKKEDIKEKMMETIFSSCEDEILTSDKLSGKHFTFGMNNSNMYFYMEGFGLYKISQNKVVEHSKSPELLNGDLSFVFLNNTDDP